MCYVYFYSYVHLRDLHIVTHTFPTRRSTDLIALKEKQGWRHRFNVELFGIDGDVVLISDKEGVEHRLPFDAIDTAKLVLTDKLIAATVPLSIEGADEMEEEGQD